MSESANASVLVIEDDPSIRSLLGTALELENRRPLLAATGRQGLQLAASCDPCLVLLDLGLPDMDGLEVLKRLRSWSGIPVIVLSARTMDADKVALLDAGADDYLTKPFSIDELGARIRAALRHAPVRQPDLPEAADVLRIEGLEINRPARTVQLDGQPLHLTPTEYRLLCLLAENAGKVISYASLTRALWGTSWDGDVSNLRTNMANLRRKLQHRFIETRIGTGYIFSRLE